jgi:hypothetical protein
VAHLGAVLHFAVPHFAVLHILVHLRIRRVIMRRFGMLLRMSLVFDLGISRPGDE